MSGQPTRREFLQTSSAAVMATTLAAGAASSAADNEIVRVGLIGCGGRGTGAVVQALRAEPKAEITALGDAFQDRAEAALTKLRESGMGDRMKNAKIFTDFDNYQKVIDACDVVVLAAPPAFRPKHLRAAIDAGKHVFAEKPVAVDGPGVRSVLETCELAKKKNLCVVSGLCYRYQFAKQATMERIHDGAIGDIVALQTTYNTGGLWHRGNKPEWSEIEYQMRNWLYFDWLSGDHINEQHIHSLDKIAWAMQDEYPIRVTASGGRIVRTDPKYGNIYDHFNSVFEWASGVKGFSSCRQWVNADTDVSDHVFGTKGVAHIQQHTIDRRNGDQWRYEGEGPDDMYQNEHDALFEAIRSGKPINNGRYMSYSTMMAIMARMSAYSGRTITWEEAINSEEVLGPETLRWGAHPVRPVATPGKTKAV